MNTEPQLALNSYFETIINSYEDQIQKIQMAFQSSEIITESSHTLSDYVRNSLKELKKERESLNSRLCETLAKNGSLRKKDYNKMMSDILDLLDKQQWEAERKFLDFVETQKEIAQLLKNSLLGLKNIGSQDADDKIASIRKQLSSISILGEKRKEMVLRSFMDFQKMHSKTMGCFKSLLEKNGNIMAKDIKYIKKQIYPNSQINTVR